MAQVRYGLQLLQKLFLSNLSGWRRVVACGSMCTALALVCNIAMLIWASTKPRSSSNTFVLYDGDCEDVKSTSVWPHLAINIVSTLILSGSNYAMQVLSAPTRANADIAHRRGRSVVIGIPSLSNWTYLGRRRRLLYIGLLLTSVPFHTIYNSVIFETTSAVKIGVYLATDDFLEMTPTSKGVAGNLGCTVWERASQHRWQNLTKEDCYITFSQFYVHDYMNVILMTNTPSTTYNETLLASTIQSLGSDSPTWFCGAYHCTPDLKLVENWNVSFPYDGTQSQQQNSTHYTSEGRAFVQYCLAEPTKASCTVELSPHLLGAAIGCNIIKVVILILLLCSTSTPLVTIGDAIASYIDEPDTITIGWGAVSGMELRRFPFMKSRPVRNKPWMTTLGPYRKQPWCTKPPRYFSGATQSRWAWTLWLCFSYLNFGLFVILYPNNTVTYESLQQVWQDGLGSIAPGRVEPWHMGFLSTVVIANLPQLVLSVVYLLYNSVLTSLLLSQGWTNYVHHRKGLRVTKSEGEQRSTYFLSLPYRFSIPLLIASALLHWSLSQSIFFAQVNYTDYNGLPDPADSILTVGLSIIGFLILVFLGFIMILALILFSFFRHYRGGIPLALSDSRAISAACHCPASRKIDEERPSLKKLQYGVIADLGNGRYHVGFSDGSVTPLVEGEHYYYRGMLDDI